MIRSSHSTLVADACRLVVLCVLALGSTPAAAQDTSDCLNCHADADLVSPRVLFDEKLFAQSVHSQADCVDCHVDLADVKDYPHAAKLAPAQCGDCHDEELESMAAYWNGTHGRLVRKGDPNAPRCADCHGGHGIRKRTDPRSRAFILNVPAMCTQCHAEGEPVHRTPGLSREQVVERYKDRIHGLQFFAAGLKVTAVCTSCHGHHAVLPASDPKSSINKDRVNQTCAKCHGEVQEVHRGVVAPELWNEPGMVPICVDCHIPHVERHVAYGTHMSDGECMACHGKPDIREQGASLFVDAEQVRTSVHGRHLVACAMCHAGVRRSEGRSCATGGKTVDCATCHDAVVQEYQHGVHGKLHAKGDPNAPSCVDCHGSHGVMESSYDRLHPPPEALRERILASPTHRRNVPDLCARCHRAGAPAAVRHPGKDPDRVEHYRMSVHGKGLTESGLIASANCVDCHSAHEELPLTDPESTVNRDHIADTCGQCHDGIYEQFRRSIHSEEGNPGYVAAAGGPELPECNDCHSSHSVERTDLPQFKRTIVTECAHCHRAITDSYFNTYHGKVSALGDTVAARCNDCHGSHAMLAPDQPGSTLSKDNIVATCGKCHPGSHAGFVGYLAHGTHHDPERYPALYWSFVAMTVLLLGVFGFFGLHVLAWLPRSLALRRSHRAEVATAEPGAKQYLRFSRFNRNLHIMIIVSFLGLTMTGMALKFAEAGWAKVLAGMLGGPVTCGWIHRTCALITFGYFGLHLFDVARRFVRRKGTVVQFFFGSGSMVPTWRDVKEFAGTVKWFLGRGPRPKYGKWTYWEKFDYFAVFWGVAIIGLSGLILWFPELVTHVLPGWMINVATIIHSEEALLAAGFIFTIHFFNTHLRPEKFPIDTVVFTGRMTVDELKVDKPGLYEELVETGRLEDYLVDPPSPRAQRAARVFGFTALVIGIVCIVLIVDGLLTVGL